MLKLYLLRHGQTDYNLNNIVQGGGVDSDLNATGRKQGEAFFKTYYEIPFDAHFCSGLKRTRQTIQQFHCDDRPLKPLQHFNEFNWGELEGQEGTPEIRQQFRYYNERWTSGELDLKVSGDGESPKEAWERLHEGFWKVVDEVRTGNVLICTHGRVLRILLSGILGYGLENMNLFEHTNTGLNVLRVSRSRKVIAEKINDLRHLQK